MKKSLTVIIVIAACALALFGWVKSSYNALVQGDESVKSAWSQVENVYQRRADLIPNLVATVKGYASHESETLQAVVEARSNATGIKIDPSNMTAEDMARFQAAQSEIGSALGRLIAVAENYPDLKASANFLDLQQQLEGTENRIAVERRNFNEVARAYNTRVRSFPTNIVASVFGFGQKSYFTADEGAKTAPKVEF